MTQAHLIERHPGIVDLVIKSKPSVAAYRIGVALTLDAAYAGTTPIFDVKRGHGFRSKTLVRNQRSGVRGGNRGLTRITYSPEDFVAATVPGDNQPAFLRVSTLNHAGVVSPEGPILVVPPPGFFTSVRRNLILNGTAPSVPGLGSNLPPQDSMWVHFPKFWNEAEIFNDGAASLWVALAPGTQELEILPGTSISFTQSGSSLVSFRGDGATVAFRGLFSLVNGIQC